MAVRRAKVDRKISLVLDEGRVLDLPPAWSFTVTCEHHGDIHFDFNPYRANGRDDLAAHMRDAFWSMRREVVGATLQYYERSGLRHFWRFLDVLAVSGQMITRLDQIDRQLINHFLTWLDTETVVIKRKNKGRHVAIGSKLKHFATMKTLLLNRQKLVPSAVHPALTFPRNPFSQSERCSEKRESYSPAERERILDALRADLQRIHDPAAPPLPPMQVLAVHLFFLALTTGKNLQPLLELKRNSLRNHPLEDRELLITTKRRGWSTHTSSFRKAVAEQGDVKNLQSIPASIGDHVRFLMEYTAPLAEEAEAGARDFIFLWRVTRRERCGQVVRLTAGDMNMAKRPFAKRHGLLDDQGQPLTLNVSRLRPTFATELYRRTRDIRRVQQALGHARVETTARHYATAPLEAERDHAIVLAGMVAAYTRYEFDGLGVVVAADGKVPLADVVSLARGGYNTGVARCQNPFRENDKVCQKLFHCFKCPNMCVFEDDLWRLFSFYYRLLAERVKVNPAHWLKTYGPIIRRIDSDIAPLFPAEKVAIARQEAQANPHPTWKAVFVL
ncbi:MAG: tyrosine-type recombinase/integrase [Propionivibrio sp.]|nr:tyrosine-type recombinase/integrase [Propionivibrio sp.]